MKKTNKESLFEEQVAIYKKKDKEWYKKLRSSELSEEYMILANGFRRARGYKDEDGLISDMKILQVRNNATIWKDIFNDDKASHINDEGHYVYSGIGKTVGLRTYVELCKLNDGMIDEFYYMLKHNKMSLKETKTLMSARYGAKL